eukprot:11679366-Heterocapsa_arctica.AAC.1
MQSTSPTEHGTTQSITANSGHPPDPLGVIIGPHAGVTTPPSGSNVLDANHRSPARVPSTPTLTSAPTSCSQLR